MPFTFVGQIIMTSLRDAPRGSAACDGAVLPTNQNQALFALLGARYGGNGQTSFALPDLRGRTPAGGFASQNDANRAPGYIYYALGEMGGTETTTLNAAQNPTHGHTLSVTSAIGVNQYADGGVALGAVSDPARLYGPADTPVTMRGGPPTTIVGGQPHPNMQPFLVVNFAISLQNGRFPTRE